MNEKSNVDDGINDILVYENLLQVKYQLFFKHFNCAGDYMQLLNLIPLDGLEITLKHVKMNGCAGVGPALDRLLEAWVSDIYANQLYRVISGLAPVRGLSNIGADLQDLLSLPLSHAVARRGERRLLCYGEIKKNYCRCSI